eukprot:TRINITY_DN105029_c0_g1_i1.p1 TRINITY_DN105029_c0_g1~~TRINITY_DN105029_c0_g1_i1.p1  ORF type:complete len:205 (-),score=56.01 TRINITY_DN105029_c0_g1_i1:86-700(-)
MDKTKSGRRLSWADQETCTQALSTIIAEMPPAQQQDDDDEDDESPEADPDVEVEFGVLRIGALYGASAHLPAGTTAAEVVDPLPPGITAQVMSDPNNGSLYLWCECQLDSDGKRRLRFSVRLEGAAQPAALVELKAAALSLPDGRPSRVLELHNNVQLLRAAAEACDGTQSEGIQWRKASHIEDPEELAEALAAAGITPEPPPQ